MPISLFQLSHKKFMRSSQFETKIAIKILMSMVIIYFAGSLLLGGIMIYPALADKFPQEDTISIINNILIYIFVFELFVRYFLQQLPVTEIKSFLLLPILKKRIIRNVLFRSLFSFYNAIPYLFYLPISIYMYKDDYSFLQAFTWWLSLTAISLSFNFITFLVNKSNKVLVSFVISLILLFTSKFVFGFDLLQYFGLFFDFLLANTILVTIPILFFCGMYLFIFRFLKNRLNLEGSLATKVEVASANQYNFLDAFGGDTLFLRNDIRLIVRNIRPRNIVLISFLFLFYGIIFFTQDNQPEYMVAFAAIFITGGFLMTYGNYVPAWDSEYYSFLMCQNLSYRKYLDSKWRLMFLGVLLSTVLSLPYLYFGTKIYLIILAGAFFNIGLGTWITLYGGLLNKQALKLNVKAKAFENTQAFSGKQFLMVLPKMVLPVVIYIIPTTIFNSTIGIIVLSASGVLGIIFKKQILDMMAKLFKKHKYDMINAFTQK